MITQNGLRVVIIITNVIFRNYPNRSQHDVDAFLHKNQITMKGRDIPLPVMHFQEAGFPEPVINTIRKSGFENPTSIQAVGWPIALSGRDMVGIAQTGSGKTLAVS